MTQPFGEYDRGVVAGQIDQRLAQHDKHFEQINGSLGDVARELHVMGLAVQRLADQAESRDATVIKTAAALKDAEDARRAQGETRWTPFTRVIALVGAIAGLVVAVITVRSLTK